MQCEEAEANRIFRAVCSSFFSVSLLCSAESTPGPLTNLCNIENKDIYNHSRHFASTSACILVHMSTPNYYEILSLPLPPVNAALDYATLKAAYRHALLAHHPDKSPLKPAQPVCATFSVDDITLAYQTLSNPQKRIEYDRSLWLATSRVFAKQKSAGKDHTGVEVVDLDDMIFDEDSNVWSRSCRCGSETGFMLNEADLDLALKSLEERLLGHDRGEVVVECTGCTLTLKIEFVATDQD